jgi:hypothetical protein
MTTYSTCLLFVLFSTIFLFMFFSTILLPPPAFVCVHSSMLPFTFVIICSLSIALSILMLLWTPNFKHAHNFQQQTQITFDNYPFFISSLNFLLITFIFLLTCHFLINAWSLKLIWPITTSSCVPCIAMWKHFMSSIWMNAANFIFWLLHIRNLCTLVVLTPPYLPCTPFVDYTHLSIDHVNSSTNYDNTYVNCIDFSIDCANKYDDCANTLNS